MSLSQLIGHRAEARSLFPTPSLSGVPAGRSASGDDTQIHTHARTHTATAIAQNLSNSFGGLEHHPHVRNCLQKRGLIAGLRRHDGIRTPRLSIHEPPLQSRRSGSRFWKFSPSLSHSETRDTPKRVSLVEPYPVSTLDVDPAIHRHAAECFRDMTRAPYGGPETRAGASVLLAVPNIAGTDNRQLPRRRGTRPQRSRTCPRKNAFP